MSDPISSGELYILMGLIDLAKRCGVRPADADAMISFEPERGEGKDYRVLFVWGDEYDPGLQRFQELLGVKGEEMYASTLDELEDRVDRALSLAPRARTR